MNDTPCIEIEALEFGFRRGETTLDIPQFSVPRGGRVFLSGPSGSGKSTLLNVIGAVLVPRAGEVRVLGTPLERLRGARRDAFRADHVGFIFQQFNLIPWLGVVDNVILPARFSKRRRDRAGGDPVSVRRRAGELLAHLGLAGDTVHDRTVTELSVGQQQRVAAARALLGGPELVIADEPTSSLDAGHRASFLELLDAECRAAGSTLLFVSHDPTLAAGFDARVDLAAINRAVAELP